MNTNFESDLNEFKKYLSSYCGVSDNTVTTYICTLKFFQQFLLNRKISYINISNKDAEDFINYLHNKGMSKKTIEVKLYSLRKFYNYLKLIGKVDEIHFDLIKTKMNSKKQKPKNYIVLTENDFELIIKHCEKLSCDKFKLRNKLIFYLLYYTGIRVSELVNIQIKDFDSNFEKLTLFGKGNKQNVIYITKEIQKLIKGYIVERKKIKSVYSYDYLIVNPRFEKLARQGINHIVRRLLGSEFKHITPHSFRYTFATSVYEQTKSISTAKILLNHSSSVTTQVYLDVDIDKLHSKILKGNAEIEEGYRTWLKI